MKNLKHCLAILALLASCHHARSEDKAASSKAPQEAVETWKDMRFGMFIHWGPVALTGHEIGWSRGRETPIEEYDNLYKRFNPVDFDADEWVRVAKEAGMKYVVLTAKHHDGFCLWPSDYAEYDIAATPFGRDVVGELAEACRKAGIGFGTYYSTLDWWHPDYPKGSPGGRTDKPDAEIEKYIEYMRNQTVELVENYGPLTTMWFDIPWEVTKEHNEPTVQELRRLQPDIMINNRAYYSPKGFGGDYNTPEQRVGGFDRDRPWESCMTIANQWAWKPNDEVKSLSRCIRALLGTIGGDGNFLFNVGPDAMGVIEPEQIVRLKEMGDWVSQYKEGIYGTRGGPFIPAGWGASTHKDDRIYVYVFRWPDSGKLILPLTEAKILAAENLSGEKMSLTQVEGGYALTVPVGSRDASATVVRLKVDRPAGQIEPITLPSMSGSLAFKKPAKSSLRKGPGPPEQAFDDEPDSAWQPRDRDEAWLAVDLQKPTKVSRIKLLFETVKCESFSVQYKRNGEWVTIVSESEPDHEFEKQIDPVTAQHFRLVLVVKDGLVELKEFQLF